jgi:hypothetical protein
MEQWLAQGGSPPRPLQQLRDQRLSIPTPKRVHQLSSRWAQTGFIWRQLMRQWLLLEPLLLELPAPLQADGLFGPTLRNLKLQLLPEAAAGPQSPGPTLDDWLQVARRNNASPPMILAIAEQLEQLQQLLHSRALVRQAIDREQCGAA